MKFKVNISVYIFLFLSNIWFTSCGASKRNIVKNEKAVEVEYDIKRTDKSIIETNILTTKTATETIFEPIDGTKPIIVGSDTIHNAKVVTRHVKTDIKDESTSSKDVVEVDRSKSKTEEKNKVVDSQREGFNWQGLKSALIWIGIILVIAIVGWIVYRMRWKR